MNHLMHIKGDTDMNSVEPTLQEWKECIAAALHFKQLRCWNWITDEMVFGVQNPEDGKIGYCCIMGSSDDIADMAALSIHLGSEGLEGLRRIRSEDLLPDELLHAQHCIMVSFENREMLEKHDVELYKKIGLKCSKNGWPYFRYFEPGYVPWLLSGAQVRFMTIAIKQVIETALRFKSNPGLLRREDHPYYLVRVPFRRNGGLIWTDRWAVPEPMVRSRVPAVWLDELSLRRIQGTLPKWMGIWEMDVFYAPVPLKGRDKLYFPKMCLIVDHYSGEVLHTHWSETGGEPLEFVEQWIALMQRLGGRPFKLLVQREEVLESFESVALGLNIQLERAPRLYRLEEIKMHLYDELAPF
ncbi:Uncharacterised protein [Chlamydia abortus]|nr:Uncharacterised protein [Chlamydia abortus]